MPCPFFVPAQPFTGHAAIPFWPLAEPRRGSCSVAPPDEQPGDAELKKWCNFGYACGCRFLPKEREADKASFSVIRSEGEILLICCVLEKDHRPVSIRTLQFHRELSRWLSVHPDARIQRQAECYMESRLRLSANAQAAALAMATSDQAGHAINPTQTGMAEHAR